MFRCFSEMIETEELCSSQPSTRRTSTVVGYQMRCSLHRVRKVSKGPASDGSDRVDGAVTNERGPKLWVDSKATLSRLFEDRPSKCTTTSPPPSLFLLFPPFSLYSSTSFGADPLRLLDLLLSFDG